MSNEEAQERGPLPGATAKSERRVPLIVCEAVDKVYAVRSGSPIVALKSLNIEVPGGEFLTVVGPSGCGKSTLLRLLAGIERNTRGKITLAGETINGPRKDIGFVFQTPTLLAWRNVMENIMLPLDVLGLPRKAFHARVLQLIKMVKLDGFEQKYPWELSGGMQQRVAICRAMINEPQLLLMDEPFGAVDALTREAMNIELEALWLNTRQTILLITHSIAEAVFLGTRVAVMSARPGTIADVISIELHRPRTLDLITSPQFGAYVRQIRHVLDAANPEPNPASSEMEA
jgi:NitT/TauT family transport system ATP-binding protein